MLNLFIAYLTPGGDPSTILTADTKSDTGAAVMTPDEAKAVGFGGLPEIPGNVALIVVKTIDRGRIINALEASPIVAKFSMHDVDG
jgi:hypothetical protein